ncbi:dienelactone hydrolase-like protein [Plenodomus tracheiphilus IPT5]|uniref:Dienelactone hydrolase-like protein n=1 Tax=Plenodomus tracheiphilus IPT5 TaxID=1408161 RepID=A0A6A7AT23_9PLEO|nr:dienelactone hydrolase-like protein [Plenodomus tracheiphilus IPT5]
MSITSFEPQQRRFLHFNSGHPRIYFTSSIPLSEKDIITWTEEGFSPQYLPYDPAQSATYTRTLKSLHENLALGENYALVAYGDAATVVLRIAQKPLAKCCAVIAFYPKELPESKIKYPNAKALQVHVAGLSPGSAGARAEMYEWGLYRYEKCALGFAEPASKSYKEVEANLAYARTLACVRRGFNRHVDLEPVTQGLWDAKYMDDVPERASMSIVRGMSQNSPHITIFPTLEGGVGRKKLEEFYREFFVPSLVEDFDIRLVSRTVGVNRVVDEMVVSFTHDDEVDWILPGVPPTDKFVQVPMVSVVAVVGGKLVSEHMYWDQASVLMQVGLLDPKLVPTALKSKGLKELPVTGAEAAKQLVEPQQRRYNKLLKEHGLMDGL